MKKYIIGGMIGFLAFPFFLMLISGLPINRLTSIRVVPHTSSGADAYSASAASYRAGYNLEAPFIDKQSSVTRVRPMGLYREVQVFQFLKGDFANVCLRSFSDTEFDVAVTLRPDVREEVLADMLTPANERPTSLRPGGYSKRYYFEAGGDLIHWFWVSGAGAQAYEGTTKEDANAPDFVLTAPLHQLKNFQFYMINAMTNAPLEACSAFINREDMPGWNEVVKPFWNRP